MYFNDIKLSLMVSFHYGIRQSKVSVVITKIRSTNVIGRNFVKSKLSILWFYQFDD